MLALSLRLRMVKIKEMMSQHKAQNINMCPNVIRKIALNKLAISVLPLCSDITKVLTSAAVKAACMASK